MTTGASIYLVSACSSGEEFVAAFRRYADRTGLFIPVSEPLPAGRRGRVALTLKDGGVMVEGEAEVIASSPKPSALHGRIGMTIRFVDPDEPSKIVLAELEKARLAMKPAPPSVPPRPADIPAEPRPVPPAPGGRIDANNALAECVMIGDIGTLRDGGGSKAAADAAIPPPKASQKFVVPSIPGIGGAPGRPKTPSTPPEPRPKTPSVAPEVAKATTLGMPAIDRKPEASPAPDVGKATTLGMPALDKQPHPASDVGKATTLGMPLIDRKPETPVPAPMTTVSGVSPAPAVPSAIAMPRTTTSPGVGSEIPSKNPALAQTVAPGTPVPQHTVPGTGAPARRDPTPPPGRGNRATVMGPAIAPPKVAEAAVISSAPTRDDPTTPSPIRSAAVARREDPTMPAAPRTAPSGNASRPRSGTAPPRFPTPVAPLPVTRLPAQPAPPIVSKPPITPIAEVDLGEPTDLSSIPTDPHQRKTSVGEAVPFDAPTVDSGRALSSDALAPPSPSPGIDAPTDPPTTRASQILAAIPSGGDWTMTPDASQPTVLPKSDKVSIPDPTPAPGPAPTGDWTISLADGGDAGWDQPSWAEPQAAPKPRIPGQAATPKTGNPVFAVASDKPLSSEAPEDRPTAIEPKVEIDPTLMEPLKPMPPLDDEDDEADQLAPPPMPMPMPTLPGMGGPIPPPLAPMPMPMHVAMELGPVTPAQRAYVTPPHGSAPIPMGGHQPMPPNMDPQQMAMMSFPPPPQQQRMVTDGGAGFFINDSAQVPRYPSDATVAIDPEKKRRRTMIIIGGVAFLVVLIVVLIAIVGGGSKPKAGDARATGKGSSHAIKSSGSGSGEVGAGSGSQHVAVTDPSHTEVKTADAAVAPGKCTVEVTTVPPGAEIALDATKDTVLGTSPGTFELPCDVESKLYIRKAKYNNTIKPVTATAETAKVSVKLSKQTFALKVTSTPAGATITVGGKNVGVTPTTIKVTAFDTTAITLSKDGYTPDTQKIPAKQNNAAHHVILKKVGPKKPH